VIFATENSNKFQKTMFCKEKLVEDVVTLGPTAQATLVSIKYTFFGILFFLWKVDHHNKKSPNFFPNKLGKKKTLVLECGPHQKMYKSFHL
jgi:hypothetical protein